MTSSASKAVPAVAGGHLCEDLEIALQEKKMGESGSYRYSSLLPFAPYPCLNIEGLGCIGLPLSETEAKRVIASASEAPHGRGNQTSKKVQDTWEINPARVKFENPNWLTYVQDMAVQTVSPALGLKKLDTPPRCELYKLLIYGTGSCLPPHKETKKADGIFATMIIFLPSRYTGGEIHLTHASKTQVIDFSASSLTSTAVLAWYTDVLHEVKPVTSGYQLALSYNLIHTSSRMPVPMAPADDGPCGELRKLLDKWEKGRYEKPKDCDYIAYLLKHQYDAGDFSRGVSCLKGQDKERVALVRAAAEGLGFVILLANMEYHVSGGLDDCDYGWSKRRPICAYDPVYSRFGDFGDGEVDDFDNEFIDVTLSNIVDLDGNVVLGPKRSMEIGEDLFLPRHALDGASPDHSMESGYSSYEGTAVAYSYRRSVFVLILSDKLPGILLRNGGIEYVMKLFKDSLSVDAPTKNHKELAKQIISNLYYNAGNDKVPITKAMFNFAYKLKDVEIWQQVFKSWGNIEAQGENGLLRAWRVFKFDQTCPGIEDLLRNRGLTDKLTSINTIRQAASESNEKDAIQKWCSNQVSIALTSYVSPNVKDAPFLASMAGENGIQSIRSLPIEKFVPEKAFQFLTLLLMDLVSMRTVVLQKTAARCARSKDPQSEAARTLDEFIRSCLDCAGKQWDVVTSGPLSVGWYPTFYPNQRLKCILDIVELCLLTRQMDKCSAFLDKVWNAAGEVVDKFEKTYTPLVPELCKLLQKTSTDVCSPPFIDFFRLLISHYLCYVLGTKGQNVQPARKIGCGCADCQELDRFIVGKESTHTFRFVQKRRSHLEQQMNSARDLVTHETERCGSPYSLVVKKTNMWEYRIKAVNTMFGAIGAKNVEKIMGNRYGDVCAAIRGQGSFRLDKTVVQRQDVPGPVASTSTVKPSKPTTSVIGSKRKRETEVITVMDD